MILADKAIIQMPSMINELKIKMKLEFIKEHIEQPSLKKNKQDKIQVKIKRGK